MEKPHLAHQEGAKLSGETFDLYNRNEGQGQSLHFGPCPIVWVVAKKYVRLFQLRMTHNSFEFQDELSQFCY